MRDFRVTPKDRDEPQVYLVDMLALVAVIPVSSRGQPMNSGDVALSITGSLVCSMGLVSSGLDVGEGIVVFTSSRLSNPPSVSLLSRPEVLVVVVIYSTVVVADTDEEEPGLSVLVVICADVICVITPEYCIRENITTVEC